MLSLLDSSVPIMHIFGFNYVFMYPLIPYVLIIPWPGALMNLCIISLYINSNTDNIHIEFEHLYCFIHPSVLSYIIPYFMNKLFLYIQWINFFIFSNLVATFWAEASKNVSEINLHLYLTHEIFAIFIVILTGTVLYWESEFEAKCLWPNFHVKWCLQGFRIIMLYHHRIIGFQKKLLL